MSKGFLLVVSGPSGSGKGTVCNNLLNRNNGIVFSVSTTTRSPREGEVDGKDYFFIDKEKHFKMIENNEFLENAEVHDNFYGTPKEFVFEEIEKGNVVLLEIDVQGALQVKDVYSEAVTIFLVPPSMEELERRIRNRGTETEESINLRMYNALIEMKVIDQYDYIVINDEIDNIADDELVGLLEDLVLDIEGAYNYIRSNFKE